MGSRPCRKITAYQPEFQELRKTTIAKIEEDKIQKEVDARISAIKQAEARRLLAEQEESRKAAFEAEVNRRVQEALQTTSLIGGGSAKPM